MKVKDIVEIIEKYLNEYKHRDTLLRENMYDLYHDYQKYGKKFTEKDRQMIINRHKKYYENWLDTEIN